MKSNVGPLIFSIFANWMVEIMCACIFATAIATNIFNETPFGIPSRSKMKQNINEKLNPWILPKRKPPDKLGESDVPAPEKEKPWMFPKRKPPDKLRESAVPVSTNQAQNKATSGGLSLIHI